MALPKEIVFQSAPSRIVTIKSGQMGYKRSVKIMLKKNKNGDVYFMTKHGAVYVQSPNAKNIFAHRAKKRKRKRK